MKVKSSFIYFIMVLVASVFVIPNIAGAHCDTLAGPVVLDARTALEKGEITSLLKWVRKEDEKEIREAFNKTLTVRKQGKEAKELADMYFFETLVRVHRAGEGAPYTGLKPAAAVDPAVALADKSLESGSVDKLVEVLTQAMSKGIRERFNHASEAQKHAEHTVETGREFVEAYVIFTHYIEQLHLDIEGKGLHGAPAKPEAAGVHKH